MPDPGRWSTLLLLASMAPAALTGQGRVEALAEDCRGGDTALEERCREGALAVQAAQGGIGLLAAGGAQVPGASSTIGRRFGGTPRFSGSLRGGLARVSLPDVRSSGGPPFRGRTFTGVGAQASLALGLLDGFSLVPTVGGVLSLDVFGTLGFMILPEGHGFRDNPVTWGVGANVGILRESFTMPGVTVSVARRGVEAVRLGDRDAGDAMEIRVDPSITSLRGVVGKDLLAVGVLGGVGWDRYRSDPTLQVTDPGGSVGVATGDGFTSDRVLFFGGVSLSLLLLQLSTEIGWARGFEDVPGWPARGHDPGSGSLFLSAAARLTL